jgi:hypothetical protein
VLLSAAASVAARGFPGATWDEHGLSVFDVLRYRLRDYAAVLCVFDLIELDGEDLRWQPRILLGCRAGGYDVVLRCLILEFWQC